MRIKVQQSSLYRIFCKAEGNQHIASEYAIEKINRLVHKFKIQKILEIGLGIGSISGILMPLNKKKLKYSGIETNQFCLNALPKNLKDNFRQLTIYSSLTEIPSKKKFDLIIIDGQDQNLQAIKERISKNGIIVIEGDRISQQNSIQKFFPDHKYVHSISTKKNKSYSPFPLTHWQGGLKVIFVNPTDVQNIWWLKEKISTKLKYSLVRKLS